ncbi:hypothetical protein CEB3_c34530 [Peptococcaceae bacterium CEB3]|nr:hypothetical protein CEB3_c34530 [Peptococcaceae bacterium CEB3]
MTSGLFHRLHQIPDEHRLRNRAFKLNRFIDHGFGNTENVILLGKLAKLRRLDTFRLDARIGQGQLMSRAHGTGAMGSSGGDENFNRHIFLHSLNLFDNIWG